MREEQIIPKERKYIEVKYDALTQGYLHEYCDANGFDLSIRFDGSKQDPDCFYFHSTVWFTTTEHQLDNATIDCYVTATATNFALFGTNQDILVLEIQSDELQELRDYYGMEYGMEDEWPDYRPHITLCYGYKGNGLPDVELPEMQLVADQLNIKTQKRSGQ